MEPRRIAVAASRESRPSAAAVIVRRFLVWTQRAGGAERAEAASALARAYLHANLPGVLRDDIGVVLAALLDDPHVAVRRALSEAFAAARGAPRALIVALANDRSEVAAPLLARSPQLTDAELVDCAAAGDDVAQCAIARRPHLGAGPAAALAEVGMRAAALALIDNPRAALTPGSLSRLFERFGADAAIREALSARADLPASLRAEIAIAAAGGALQGPAAGLAGARAARDAALAAIAAGCPDAELAPFVRTLRARGALTVALILRSLLGGGHALFVAALAELTGLSAARSAGLVADPHGAGFVAAAGKADLPRHALPVIRAALAAIATRKAGKGKGLDAGLIAAVIRACEGERDPALAPFLALLWRFAAEAARAEARAKTGAALHAGALSAFWRSTRPDRLRPPARPAPRPGLDRSPAAAPRHPARPARRGVRRR
jgi:uncharacterized protein (DUF2336 family)